MKTELYQKLFTRMDELGAIRNDITLWCEVIADWCKKIMVSDPEYDELITSNWSLQYNYYVKAQEDMDIAIEEIIGHPPILSDCISAIKIGRKEWCIAQDTLWDTSNPYLHQQSDELGEKLFTLLK